tara:strand:+ start:140 stop:322 length:183 start_codon:yes stop_codon:yes gene_type:complete
MTIRCYGSFVTITGTTRCGWVGDSGEAPVNSVGEERCPRCGGSTNPPVVATREVNDGYRK